LVVTNDRCRKSFANAETLRCGKKEVDLKRLVTALEKRGVKRLLVEGGSKVIWSFLKSRTADEVQLFVGSMVIGGECAPTPAGGIGAETEDSIVSLRLISARVLGNGVLLRYEVVK
jgi:2,5-diamino-6-(ribosylamino)-4(3H)-pyrimidinone 5'-phosphate reductase